MRHFRADDGEQNNAERIDDHGVQRLGIHLDKKSIALLVSGGIAAYKSPSLVRHFRQYGADVHVYMTPEAGQFVTPLSLEWASTNPVISSLTSQSEHLFEHDAYVIAPATYNTIGKFANGIADNAVTSTLASALGRMEAGDAKILIAPTMHGSMENSIYRQNLESLVERGVRVIEPKRALGKANLPGSHDIVVETIRELSDSDIKGKQMLITAGPAPGWIDNVRFIGNRFRGRLGIEIAEEAYLRGADVKLILGPGGIRPPSYVDTTHIRSFEEYHAAVLDELGQGSYEIGIFSAGPNDYIPKRRLPGKTPSGGALKSIEVIETPKVIKEVRSKHPGLFMVTYKYEERVSVKDLKQIGADRIAYGYEMVVANRGEEMDDSGGHACYIMDGTGVRCRPESKKEIARDLLRLVGENYLRCRD